MSTRINTVDLFKAIFQQWTAKGLNTLFTGGVTWGVPEERPTTLHAIFDNVQEVPAIFTNTSQLWEIQFDCSIYATDKQQLGSLGLSVGEALEYANLSVLPGRLLLQKPGTVRYMDFDDTFHRGILELKGMLRSPVNYTPS